MNRRAFLVGMGSGVSAGLLRAAGRERTFEITTKVQVEPGAGPTRLWMPGILRAGVSFQRVVSERVEAGAGRAEVTGATRDGLRVLSVAFPAGVAASLTVTSVVTRLEYSVDLNRAGGGAGKIPDYFLRATKLLPTDGIVKTTAMEITRAAQTDLEKARAIYDWIVENTFRDPKVRGCGLGDIRFMLESRDLGGKCADLNALFVGLARAAGLPARDVYGIRTGPGVITRSQHCRAEVFLAGYGWVPVDPADVRKAALEEGPAKMAEARTRLFGAWDTNWIAYNFAHDVKLAGSGGKTLGYLMYPQAETAGVRRDSLEPDTFRYSIAAQEI